MKDRVTCDHPHTTYDRLGECTITLFNGKLSGGWKISESIRSSAETSISLRRLANASLRLWASSEPRLEQLSTNGGKLERWPVVTGAARPSKWLQERDRSSRRSERNPELHRKEPTLQYGRIKSQTQCESERLSASYCQRTTAIVASKGGTTGY